MCSRINFLWWCRRARMSSCHRDYQFMFVLGQARICWSNSYNNASRVCLFFGCVNINVIQILTWIEFAQLHSAFILPQGLSPLLSYTDQSQRECPPELPNSILADFSTPETNARGRQHHHPQQTPPVPSHFGCLRLRCLCVRLIERINRRDSTGLVRENTEKKTCTIRSADFFL